MPTPFDAVNQVLLQRIIGNRRAMAAPAGGTLTGLKMPPVEGAGMLGGLPPGMPPSLMPVSTAIPQLPTNNPGYPSNLPTPIRQPTPLDPR